MSKKIVRYATRQADTLLDDTGQPIDLTVIPEGVRYVFIAMPVDEYEEKHRRRKAKIEELRRELMELQ